jgi:hypothetical protein
MESKMDIEKIACKLSCEEAIINFFGALDRRERELWASTLTDDAKQISPRHPAGFITMKDHWSMVSQKRTSFRRISSRMWWSPRPDVCYWSDEARTQLDSVLLEASQGREFYRASMEPDLQKAAKAVTFSSKTLSRAIMMASPTPSLYFAQRLTMQRWFGANDRDANRFRHVGQPSTNLEYGAEGCM